MNNEVIREGFFRELRVMRNFLQEYKEELNGYIISEEDYENLKSALDDVYYKIHSDKSLEIVKKTVTLW